MDNKIIEEIKMLREEICELKEALIERKVLTVKSEGNIQDTNQVKLFLEEGGEKENNMTPANEVYKAYKSWCWEKDKKALSENKFGIALSGLLEKKRGAKCNYYINVPKSISSMCKGSIKTIERRGALFTPVDAFANDIIDNEDGILINAIPCKVMYNFYKEWCEHNESRPTTINQFGAIMSRYLEKKRSSSGNVYVNLKIQEGYVEILKEMLK